MPRPLRHPSPEDIDLGAILHALADPVRLEIVRMASINEELPCKSFTDSIPKSTLSHHWRVLRDAGLLRQRHEGTQKLNSLRRADLDARFPGLIDAILANAPPPAEDSAAHAVSVEKEAGAQAAGTLDG